MQIYLAAPLFSQAEWQWNSELVSKLRATGYEVTVPQEAAWPMVAKQKDFNPTELFTSNVAAIDQSSVVLAVLDGADPDSGTSWECGYAYKAGKLVIGVRTDFRGGGDDPGTSVNLMLSRGCREIILLPMEKRSDWNWLVQRVTEAIEVSAAKARAED
jgi:nucleoside 2-deoxyribosyltransferase